VSISLLMRRSGLCAGIGLIDAKHDGLATDLNIIIKGSAETGAVGRVVGTWLI